MYRYFLFSRSLLITLDRLNIYFFMIFVLCIFFKKNNFSILNVIETFYVWNDILVMIVVYNRWRIDIIDVFVIYNNDILRYSVSVSQ